MLVTRCGNCAEVNIHGMTAREAKRFLEQYLSRAPKDILEVRVIHGYNNGQVLRDMVRRELKHPRIAAKLVSLNPGETRILLKQPDSLPSVKRKR
jgi:DNA-nicking Smr family endonuclease